MILVVVLVALVGILLGAFLTIPPLIFISCVSALVALWLFIDTKEIAKLIPMIFSVFAVLGNIAMWTTYYLATKQTFIGDWFRGLLRH